MAEQRIRFSFEGIEYTVGMEAHEVDCIRLPDGRILRPAGGWREIFPPQPMGLEIIEIQEASVVDAG